MKSHLRIFSTALLVLVLLSSCTTATSTSTSTAAQQTSEPVQKEVTLKVWDILVSETETRIADQLNQEFEAANPGVKIARESKTFDQMKETAKLGLSAADGPDSTWYAITGTGDGSTSVLLLKPR